MPMTDEFDRTSHAFLRERRFRWRVAVLAILCSSGLAIAVVRGVALVFWGAR